MFWSPSERRWIAVWSLGVVNGHRIRHRRKALTEDGARSKLEDLRRTYGAGGVDATMTLDAYLREWIAGHGLSVAPRTRTSYQGHIDLHISPLLGGIRVNELRPSDVRRLVADRLKAGKSPATVRRIVATLSIALGQAVDERRLSSNPVSGVRLPRVVRDHVRPLTPEHARKLLEAMKDDLFEPFYKLLLGSGMRPGEAVGLDQGDVFLDAGYVLVRRSKTESRAVPLSALADAAIRMQLARVKRIGEGEPLFLGPRSGARLRVDNANAHWRKMLERAGIPPSRQYELRHGAATLMLAGGQPLPVIGAQLGHKRTATTAIYAHVVPTAQRSALDAIDLAVKDG